MTETPPSSSPSRFQGALADTLSARSRKQFMLFAAGSTFVCLSVSITRRALVRRHIATIPKFYHPSNLPPTSTVNGPFEAAQALGLATLNTAAFSMALVGGTLWAADISTVDELRKKVRGGIGVDGTGRSEKDVEEEFEEWIATVLSRKEEKAKRRAGVTDELRERDRRYLNQRGKER